MHIENLSKDQFLDRCSSRLCNNIKTRILTLNTLMIMLMRKDSDFNSAVTGADLVSVDGVGVGWALKLLEKKEIHLYPGIDLFQDLVGLGYKVFLLGGKPGVAEKASHVLKRRFPSARIVGFNDGYFQKEEEIINKINACSPDMLFVGLNMRTQEIWINNNIRRINAKLLMGVGGSFDVVSGNIMRAPVLFRSKGLEWLWRLILEPQRFFRMLELPVFTLHVIIKYFKSKELFDTK